MTKTLPSTEKYKKQREINKIKNATKNFDSTTIIDLIFKCVSYWLHRLCDEWEGFDPVNRIYHTNCVDIVRYK